MGVKITHNVTHRLGRFTIALVMGIAILIHGIKNTTLNGFQTVTNVRKRTLLNNVFGVASKTLPHDVLKGHVLNVTHIGYKARKMQSKNRNLV